MTHIRINLPRHRDDLPVCELESTLAKAATPNGLDWRNVYRLRVAMSRQLDRKGRSQLRRAGSAFAMFNCA